MSGRAMIGESEGVRVVLPIEPPADEGDVQLLTSAEIVRMQLATDAK